MLQQREITPFAEVMAGAQIAEALGTVLYHRKSSDLGEKPQRGFSIRLADEAHDRDSARAIVNRMYGSRGYGSHHHIADGTDCATFIASSEGETMGTITLAIDSPAGLAADETFPDELRRFRTTPGVSLCELTKFAFDPSPESRPLLATLFHVIYIYGMQRFACTDLLIEVNPRHVRFYEVMLGFTRLGPLRVNQGVDAPSQLMHLKVADIRRNIDLFADCECYSGHSLYPHFLKNKDEQALWQRMAALNGGEIFSSDEGDEDISDPVDFYRRSNSLALHC